MHVIHYKLNNLFTELKKIYTNDLFHIVIKLLKGILNPPSIYEDLKNKLQER